MIDGHLLSERIVKTLITSARELNVFLGAMHLYALRVLATATWLAGWLSVTAGIV